MAEKIPRASANGGSSAAGIDVVVVNWNSGPHLRDCVASLDQSSIAEELHVVVVDNASTDDSASGLAAARVRLSVISNTNNCGFSQGCNQGARAGRAPAILFLNPDVTVTSETIERAVCYLADPNYPDVGIVGVQLLDQEGRIQRSCARTPSRASLLLQSLFLDRLFPSLVPPHFLMDWDHRDSRTVDQVIGAFLLIRRSLLQELGGFDERYFLYYEDVDLCLAARQAGWRVVYFAGTQARHAGGGSTNAVKGRRLYHLAVSRAEYSAKWHGRLVAVTLIVLTIGFELPIRWLHAMVTGSRQDRGAVRRAMALYCKDLRNLTSRIAVGA